MVSASIFVDVALDLWYAIIQFAILNYPYIVSLAFSVLFGLLKNGKRFTYDA